MRKSLNNALYKIIIFVSCFGRSWIKSYTPKRPCLRYAHKTWIFDNFMMTTGFSRLNLGILYIFKSFWRTSSDYTSSYKPASYKIRYCMKIYISDIHCHWFGNQRNYFFGVLVRACTFDLNGRKFGSKRQNHVC